MLLSEMIARLIELLAEHGDLDCVDEDDEPVEPEFSPGEIDAIVIS